MKHLILSLSLFFSTSILFAKDYTVYNNLTTIANKLIVGKRYVEANIIYEGLNNSYHSYFKSLDLFYWAKSLAAVEKKSESLEKIKQSLKLKNDVWGILYKVKKDSLFSFLSKDDLSDLENVQNIDYSSMFNESLAKKMDSFLLIDQSCQEFYTYEVAPLPESEEKDLKWKEFAECSDSNVNNFIDFIIKNGYPNYLSTRVDPVVLLYHINSNAGWKKVEQTLKEALKNGYIRPFDYAYTYFRANKGDEKYNPFSYPEMSFGKELSKKQKFNIESGSIGLGI